MLQLIKHMAHTQRQSSVQCVSAEKTVQRAQVQGSSAGDNW